MIPVNGALAGGTATVGIERPGGSAKRGVQEDYAAQAKNREKGAPAILKPSGHASPKLVSIIRLWVLRCSRQAENARIGERSKAEETARES